MKTSDLKSFHYLENGEVSTSILATIKSQSTLDPGEYSLDWDYQNRKPIFFKLDEGEEIEYKISKEHELLNTVLKSFFDKKVVDKFKRIGIYNKIGILLHGKEGTGKTSLVKHYCRRLSKEQGAICITMLCCNLDFQNSVDFVKKIRTVQNNPIILVFEEFEMFLGSNLGKMKLLLDGMLSIENSIVFGNTNEINQIPPALKDRKSRFKYVLEIGGIEDLEIISSICTNLIGDILSEEQIEQLSTSLIGSTLDEIKQKCIDIIMDIKSYKPKERRRVGFSTS